MAAAHCYAPRPRIDPACRSLRLTLPPVFQEVPIDKAGIFVDRRCGASRPDPDPTMPFKAIRSPDHPEHSTNTDVLLLFCSGQPYGRYSANRSVCE